MLFQTAQIQFSMGDNMQALRILNDSLYQIIENGNSKF